VRVREVQEKVKREGLKAFLFSSYPSVFYLTGFRSTNAHALLTPSERYLFTDARYYERAKKELKGWEVVLLKGSAFKEIKKFIRERGLSPAGYEEDRLTCSQKRALRTKGVKWKGYGGFLKELRAVKTEEELALLREGAKKLEEAFSEVLNLLEPGLTELEVRGLLAERYFKKGALGESFPSIVAFGEHSAVPHWESSSTPIGKKGPLLVDTGLLWKGYCTDFTRTLHLGKPSPEFLKVYEAVKEAHLRALEAAKPGVPVGEVDGVARRVLEEKGFGKFFTHATGHGVGVEIHEFPRIYYKGKEAKTPLEEGMVFTVEPGVYLPGEFGVRLENLVAVEKEGAVPLYEWSLELILL